MIQLFQADSSGLTKTGNPTCVANPTGWHAQPLCLLHMDSRGLNIADGAPAAPLRKRGTGTEASP